MPFHHDVVVKFEHILDHNQEIIFLIWVDIVSYSSQIGARISRTEWLSDTANHLGQTHQIRLMYSSLHVLLGGSHGEFEVNSGQNFPNAGHLVEPVARYFPNFVRNLSEINLGFVLVSDHNTPI